MSTLLGIILVPLLVLVCLVLAASFAVYWTTDREPTEAELRPPSQYELLQAAALREAQEACANFKERYGAGTEKP